MRKGGYCGLLFKRLSTRKITRGSRSSVTFVTPDGFPTTPATKIKAAPPPPPMAGDGDHQAFAGEACDVVRAARLHADVTCV